MLRIIFVVGFAFALMNQAVSGICQSIPASSSRGHAGPGLCTPQQPQQAKVVARTVQVAVPAPRPTQPAAPPACGPFPSLCPSVSSQPKDTRPMPVRVEVAVRPEGPEQRNPVPVVYRDPGFLGPMLHYGVGLVGATVAAPFRVAEMLLPVQAPQTPSTCQPSRPQGCRAPVSPPSFVPLCSAPARMTSPCLPSVGCAPPAPAVAPLPPCAGPPSCGPYLPPARVERPEEPPCAPQSLLGGIFNVPFVLLERGRILGDLGSSRSGAWN